MNIATQLNHVMTIIWGDAIEDCPPAITAFASYVKTHGRRNAENVFEVIDILWPRNVRTISQRPYGEFTGPGNHGFESLIDVQFDDDSQILVICRNGIGNGIEL